MAGTHRGFTLVELLVVIAIIGLVSAFTLGTALNWTSDMAVPGGAASVQAAIVTARDAAVRWGGPCGIRLIPDPTTPGCYGSWSELRPAPEYHAGLVSVHPGRSYPDEITGGRPCLVLEQAPVTFMAGNWLPAEETSWSYNIHAGDRVAIGGGGEEYTVIGPLSDDGGTIACKPFSVRVTSSDGRGAWDGPGEYLLLVNGRDDDRDGFPDNGWDGIDNDLDSVVDEADEWEAERWGAAEGRGVDAAAYAVRRRPLPAATPMGPLPAGVVIDGDNSEIPGGRDILINADGTPNLDGIYAAPSARRFVENPIQLRLTRRSDAGVAIPGRALTVAVTRAGRVEVVGP